MAKEPFEIKSLWEPTLTVGLANVQALGFAEIKIGGSGCVAWRYLDYEATIALRDHLSALLASQPSQIEEAA